MIISTILSTLISAFGLWMIFLFLNIWITLIFIIPALFLPLFVIAIRVSKVRLGNDYVEVIGLFGKKRIELNEVNKYGIFFSGKYTWPHMTSQMKINDSEDEDLIGHQIYLTTNNEFDLDSFRPTRHVRFPFRRELYFKIKEMMESKKTDAPHTR